MSQIGARKVESEQRVDLTVAGAGQSVLRGDHFDVGRDPGCETALCLCDFILSQLKSEVCDVYRSARRGQFVERGLHFFHDACFERMAILLDAILFEFRPRFFGADAPASEDREIERQLVCVSRNSVVDVPTLVVPEAAEAELRQALLAVGVGRQLRNTAFRI